MAETMTVGELITQLQTFDSDLLVIMPWWENTGWYEEVRGPEERRGLLDDHDDRHANGGPVVVIE